MFYREFVKQEFARIVNLNELFRGSRQKKLMIINPGIFTQDIDMENLLIHVDDIEWKKNINE